MLVRFRASYKMHMKSMEHDSSLARVLNVRDVGCPIIRKDEMKLSTDIASFVSFGQRALL
jgi:hypothetical protein